jgi:acyl-ACP thioesterase
MLAMKVKVGESLEIVVESDDAEAAHALAASVEALINQA